MSLGFPDGLHKGRCDDLCRRPQISQHEKVNKSRPRYVVFTQGPDPTIIAVEGKV